jgi:hypothetical protein
VVSESSIRRCADRVAFESSSEDEISSAISAIRDAALPLLHARLKEEREAFDFQEAIAVLKRGGSVRRRDWAVGAFLRGNDGVIFMHWVNESCAPSPWEPEGPFSLGARVWTEV